MSARAEAYLAENTFDRVLIDHYPGEQNGVELISRLRRRQETFLLILLAGLNDPELSGQAFAAGASDFFDKRDLSARNLDRCLRDAFRQFRTESRLREMEGQMVVAIKATESAKAARNLFLSGAGHALRTPQNTIICFRN